MSYNFNRCTKKKGKGYKQVVNEGLIIFTQETE
jgi:hypothetical protein